MGVSGGPIIVRDSSLVLELDAADRNSYQSGSNTWFDLSSKSYSASLTAATFASNSIDFTRNNNTRGTITSLDLSMTKAITVDMWVNFKSMPLVSGSDSSRLICELSDDFNNYTDTFLISIEYELTGIRWLASSKGDVAYNVKNLITPLPVINTWYNFVTVIDHNQTASNQRTFYLNSINQTNISTTANGGITYNAQNTNNFGNRIFRIGGRSTTLYSQDMLLSGFKIYSRALSAQEIQQNYNQLKSRFNL